MQPDKLFSPLNVGNLTLPNRVIMAPLTRLRSIEPGDVPVPLMAEYYAQRADAGLIISEATQISPQGKGYAGAPGIYSTTQVAAWKQITDAVHAKDGRIALQLWHVGRISHRSLQPDNEAPVAPSAIRADSNATIRDEQGNLTRAPCDTPRALETAELPLIVRDYADGAENAMAAGFDMVEIHAANGYLLNQFLSTESNQRTDAYGGSVENRARFLLEVVDAIVAKIGAARTGIRLSPHGLFNGMAETDADSMAFYLAEQLNERGIAYLHLSEPDWAGGPALSDSFRAELRKRYQGPIIGAGGYTAEKAERLIQAGLIDAAAFGRPYIANPDLVTRLKRGATLNTPDAATFYGGEAEGYTDYPTLETATA